MGQRKKVKKPELVEVKLRLDPKLKKWLERTAAYDGRSVNNYVNRLLEAHRERLAVSP